jgi:hypothetical protein
MALTIELRPDAEAALRRAAARRGMVAADLARALLEEQLEREQQSSESRAPTTGAELVAYWRAEGVVGAWAGRTDITDSATHARELRRRAETRTME